VKVRPETLALADDGQLKAERMEVLGAITQYVTTVLPMAQQAPQLAPMFLGLLQWSIAPLRGAAEVEGLIDDGVAKLQQMPAPGGQQAPPPDPKLVLAQFNAQAKKEQIALESEARQKEIASQATADNRREVVQREQNVLETLQEALIQKMIEDGWTPPGGGAVPVAAVVPPLPPPPSVAPPVPPMGG
jgi:hypothetical protein